VGLGVALVIGGAGCVWSDVEAALDLGDFDGVVACNDAGAVWTGPLTAWVSLHPEKFGRWLAVRRKRGLPEPEAIYGHEEARTHCPRLSPEITGFPALRFAGQSACGSSGLFALKVALIDLGFDRAVLCGVPMRAEDGHFFTSTAWGDCQHHRAAWGQALPMIGDRARSMSGWTRELLGAPTAAWIEGDARRLSAARALLPDRPATT
jgi:hypothetical protein